MRGEFSEIKRLAIIGGPGTGKTTLANRLKEICNLPVIHLDGINYKPNWEMRDTKQRDEIIMREIEKEKWIIDGTYKSTLKQRLERAELVIWLDYSDFAIRKGVLHRYIRNRNKEKEEIPGCKERLDKNFLRYVFRYHKETRNHIKTIVEEIEKIKILKFKKRKELKVWLEKIESKKVVRSKETTYNKKG